jgi:hypothetical protein
MAEGILPVIETGIELADFERGAARIEGHRGSELNGSKLDRQALLRKNRIGGKLLWPQTVSSGD